MDTDTPLPPPDDGDDQSFESWLEELESVVERMERGELSLEQSLSLFERGMALSERCQKALAEAEHKVRVLSGQGENATLEPLDNA